MIAYLFTKGDLFEVLLNTYEKFYGSIVNTANYSRDSQPLKLLTSGKDLKKRMISNIKYTSTNDLIYIISLTDIINYLSYSYMQYELHYISCHILTKKNELPLNSDDLPTITNVSTEDARLVALLFNVDLNDLLNNESAVYRSNDSRFKITKNDVLYNLMGIKYPSIYSKTYYDKLADSDKSSFIRVFRDDTDPIEEVYMESYNKMQLQKYTRKIQELKKRSNSPIFKELCNKMKIDYDFMQRVLKHKATGYVFYIKMPKDDKLLDKESIERTLNQYNRQFNNFETEFDIHELL